MRAERIIERLDALFEIGRAEGTNRPGPGCGRAARVRAWPPAGCRMPASRSRSDPAGNLLRHGCPAATRAGRGVERLAPRHAARRRAASTARSACSPRSTRRGDRARAAAPRAHARRRRLPARGGLAVRARRASAAGRLAGMLEPDEADLRDADGSRWARRSRRSAWASCRRRGWLEPPPACYVETHIEQGPMLAAAGDALGVVTSIAGMAGVEITFSRPPRPRGHDADGAARRRARGGDRVRRSLAHDAARSIPEAVAPSAG